jgi:hypothetical protein
VSKTCIINTGKFYILDGRVLENSKINANLNFSYLVPERLYLLYKDQSQKFVSGRRKLHILQNSAKNTFSVRKF